MKATRFLVSGIVQGVGYRFFTARAAGRLGVRGFARNLPDGRVEVVAGGPPEALRGLEEEIRRGPRAGRVERVETSEAVLDAGVDGFEIRD